MRRIDRDSSADERVIEECIRDSQVIRLALDDGDSPYIVPLCFGYEKKDGKRFFYIHKNRHGHLAELIGMNGMCTFELEGSSRLFLDHEKGTCNMDYASIIGHGKIDIVDDEAERERCLVLLMDHIDIVDDEAERERCLVLLMDHYGRGDFDFDRRAMKAILVYRIEVTGLTCKATRGW